MLRRIEEEAIAFHTAHSFDQYRLRDLIRKIGRIWPQIQLLGLLGNNDGVLITDIRRAVTLKNADKSLFQPRQDTDPMLDDISDSIDTLVLRLQTAFNEKYHS